MKTTQIQSNNPQFTAKLFSYPKTVTNKKILELFEEKAKDFPNLTLKQDNISFFGKDQFYLLEDGKTPKFKAASYTNNRAAYDTVDKIVNRFVEIFHEIRKG